MLYLRNNNEAQQLLIPRDGCLESGDMTLSIENTITKSKEVYDVRDVRMSDLYYNVAIELNDTIDDGEHEYRLEKDGLVLSEGLLLIGDYNPVEEYNNIIEYEQN